MMCNTQRYSESGKPCGVQRCEEYEALKQERDALKEELERERVRLAACGVAAMGYEDSSPLEPGSYGYSASYDDVLRFRKRLMEERDALLKVREAADAEITRLRRALGWTLLKNEGSHCEGACESNQGGA